MVTGQRTSYSSLLIQKEMGLRIPLLLHFKFPKNQVWGGNKNIYIILVSLLQARISNVKLSQFKMNYRFLTPVFISFEKDELSCFGNKTCYALNAPYAQHYLDAKYNALLYLTVRKPEKPQRYYLLTIYSAFKNKSCFAG